MQSRDPHQAKPQTPHPQTTTHNPQPTPPPHPTQINCAGPGALQRALQRVAAGAASMGDAVGPAVGCLMATMGTSLITDCIFDFEDPEELDGMGQEQRVELWGLQVRAWGCGGCCFFGVGFGFGFGFGFAFFLSF